VWISLLGSAEVAFMTCQSNVPDLRWVNGWRRGLMWMRCVSWKKVANRKSSKVSQVYTFWIISHIISLAGFGHFVVMSCIEVWVCHNVIKTEVRQMHVQWSAITITIKKLNKISNCHYDKNFVHKIRDWYNDIFMMDTVILSQNMNQWHHFQIFI
jgi:hypothetical protein